MKKYLENLIKGTKKAHRRHRNINKRLKKSAWRKDYNGYIKPINKICPKCKVRVVKFHHYFCHNCWLERKKTHG